MLLEISGVITPERVKRRSQANTIPSCGCDWYWKQGSVKGALKNCFFNDFTILFIYFYFLAVQ